MAAEDNQPDEARKQFEALLTHFPDFEQALVGLGGVYLQTHSGAQAVGSLERATKLNASDEVAWYRLAQAQRAAGNRDGAQKALDTFRKLHDSSGATRKQAIADEVTRQQIGTDVQP
jgi:predicted Zn-dependent protease